MPAKNSIKQYVENSFYHIYNRGVDKRIIFIQDLDYQMFLSYLKNYLSILSLQQVRPVRKSTLFLEIDLIAYCLMPNHFHLLIKQKSAKSIIKFMRCLINAYTRYFNTRHKRIGHLFQGKYKASLITEDLYLLQLSRYIHRNPLELFRSDLHKILSEYPYSSYKDFLGLRNTVWVKPNEVLNFFALDKQKNNLDLNYQGFVEQFNKDENDINEFILEDNVE